LYSWLTSTRLARGLADALLRRRARRRLLALDGVSPRVQNCTLLGLVHRAQGTRFGREHDFHRVRTPDDFRRLVPLRSAASLWQQYGVPALPALGGAAWPGPISYLATCDGSPGRPSPPLPVSRELVATHREALWTALALVHGARPKARLLAGSLLFVGGGAALTPLRAGVATGNLEELTRAQLPRLLRPYMVVAPYSGEASLHALAERGTGLPVTCLAGSARRLVRLFDCLRERTGCDSLLDVWPALTAILYSRGPDDPDRAALARLAGTSAGPPVLLMEACVRPEGVFAIEDPRHGLLRLALDHGIYFEFVPLEELGRPRPRRYGLEEVTTGVPYALAVTTPGLWACLTGLTVCFERNDPPLLRSIESRTPALPPAEILPLRTDAAPAGHPALPHPHSNDRAAAPARRFSRSPWSTRADQR
jgi:hypothetical protein